MLKTMLLIASLLAVAGCGAPAKTKGQLMNECLETKSPEECDREVNRRRSAY